MPSPFLSGVQRGLLKVRSAAGIEIGTLRLGKVFRSALSLSFGAGVAQALMAVAYLLTSRHLGPLRFGQFAACLSTAALASILFNWGLDSWLLRFGSQDLDGIGRLLGNALMLKIAIGVPWIVGLALLLPAIRPQTYPLLLVLVSAAAVWLEGLFTLLLVAFKTMLRNNITAWLLAGSRGAIFLITGLLIWVDVDAPLAFALIRLGTGAVLVAIAILSLPFRVRFGSAPDLRQTWVNARPFAISDLFTSVYVQADVTIAALSLSQEAVGLYTPASSMVNALFVFPSALYSVAVPVLVRVLNAAQPRQAGTVRRAFLLAMLVFGALGGMLWLGLRIGAEPVATVLLGRDFARSGGLLAILSPIIFLKSCSFALAAMLVSVGWQRRRVYAQALSALVNVGLNVALIRRFGITGVATIYVLSEGLLMLGYLLLVLRWMSSSDSRYQIHRGA